MLFVHTNIWVLSNILLLSGVARLMPMYYGQYSTSLRQGLSSKVDKSWYLVCVRQAKYLYAMIVINKRVTGWLTIPLHFLDAYDTLFCSVSWAIYITSLKKLNILYFHALSVKNKSLFFACSLTLCTFNDIVLLIKWTKRGYIWPIIFCPMMGVNGRWIKNW